MSEDRARGYSVTGAEAVVVGAGRSGVAAAGLLARRGARVTLSERLADPPEVAAELRAAGVTLELGGHRPETLAAADLIVLSPGVSPRLPEVAAARERGTPVMSELELAARWLRGRIVAVTGTKGKSTTVVLTGRMLDADGRRAVVGGNIGVALSSQVEASTPDAVHVVEASSFQLELTDTFRPWIAVCLNLSPDHLDRHASFAEYAEAKGRIFANQTGDDAMVINADDPAVLELARKGRARALRFAIDAPLADGVLVTDEWITRRSAAGEERLIPRAAVQMPGRHLLSDVAAAAAVGSVAGVAAEAMTQHDKDTPLSPGPQYVWCTRGEHWALAEPHCERRWHYRQCGDCWAAYNRDYHARNKEAINQRSRDYRTVNQAVLNAKQLVRYHACKDERREYARQYDQTCRGKELKRNRDSRRRGQQARVEQRPFPNYWRDEQFQRQKGLCQWCGKRMGRDATIDHVVPLSRGGANAPENCVLVHHSCNSGKRDRLVNPATRQGILL